MYVPYIHILYLQHRTARTDIKTGGILTALLVTTLLLPLRKVSGTFTCTLFGSASAASECRRKSCAPWPCHGGAKESVEVAVLISRRAPLARDGGGWDGWEHERKANTTKLRFLLQHNGYKTDTAEDFILYNRVTCVNLQSRAAKTRR